MSRIIKKMLKDKTGRISLQKLSIVGIIGILFLDGVQTGQAGGVILMSLIFSFLLSNITLKLEKISMRPRIYGQEGFSENRQWILNSSLPILAWIFPNQTATPFVPSIPYERSLEQFLRSIPIISAICLGNIEKSAPLSRIKLSVWYPNLVRIATGILGSETEPRRVTFLERGNSIGADYSFRFDVFDNQSFISQASRNFSKKIAGSFCRGDNMAIEPGDEFTTVSLLKLDIRNCFHNFYLHNKFTTLTDFCQAANRVISAPFLSSLAIASRGAMWQNYSSEVKNE